MDIKDKKTGRKGIIHVIVFIIIMILTFYAVLRGQDLFQIWEALGHMSAAYFLMAILTALFFVCIEGGLLWYLLKSMGDSKSGFLRCISYSFIGFFYSSITPSASGGQPMQLYYMNQDGNSLSGSSVALMTVALLYKFVLVMIGICMTIFWYIPLKGYLQKYFGLYFLGLALNTGLVIVLLAAMMMPDQMKALIEGIEGLLVRFRVLKYSDRRKEKIGHFIEGYRNAERYLILHKGRMALMTAIAVIQRFSVFYLTVLVYQGFSLQGVGFMTIMLLQAAVYITVDMLPLPGAQGITELVYCRIFSKVFTGGYLMPSLYVTRGINFYFLLFLSLCVEIGNQMREKAAK
ncbi:MAG: flippase-like domain-containing protein [Clostridia bacterium]|nr:flippase-like domain-containing protein [Clostridia bacterium]MCI8866377.1 flippase-like domain-containing protein [Lachnospiraceae bacterium]